MKNQKTDRREDFWSANPCGGDSEFSLLIRLKYSKEPWIPPLHHEIARKHHSVLEIGFGQGIDAYHLSSQMHIGSKYLGIDFSKESVLRANQLRPFATSVFGGSVEPCFQCGDAEKMKFDCNSQDCIYSIGVLHHTSSPHQAISEVFRVLKPGGIAYIAIYANPSLKVGIAKLLRMFQFCLDGVLGTDRVIYQFLKKRKLPWFFGTILHECFGVPWMWWFKRSEVEELFRDFSLCEIMKVGYNIPFIHSSGSGRSILGYFWLVKATKPLPA